jgi:hypothetical protein
MSHVQLRLYIRQFQSVNNVDPCQSCIHQHTNLTLVNIEVHVLIHNYNACVFNASKCHISQHHNFCIYISNPFQTTHLCIKDPTSKRSSPRRNAGGKKKKDPKNVTVYESDDESSKRKVRPTTPGTATTPSHAGFINPPRVKQHCNQNNAGPIDATSIGPCGVLISVLLHTRG